MICIVDDMLINEVRMIEMEVKLELNKSRKSEIC